MIKRRKIYTLFLLSGIFIYLQACRHDPYIAGPGKPGDTTGGGIVTMTPYEWKNPPFFPFAVIPEDNQMFKERIALGRQLFYDDRLSNNGESCNSCHKQQHAFSVAGVSQFDKGLTAPSLENLAWYENFMWTGRIRGKLEDVMYKEITERFVTDMLKVNNIAGYRDQFKKYYGVEEITAADIAKPLAQFMRVLVSRDTKYEKSVQGLATLTPDEEAGRQIFFTEKGDCFHCHVAVLATDNMMHNNGIDSLYTKEIDKGYFNVTGDPKDLGKFRTPNLRNVAVRTDFMHDGRFKTLMEVVNFYDHQVHIGVSNIDPIMVKPGKEDGLNLTEQEKLQLIAFLNTLTDTVMLNNPDFAAP